MKFPSTPTFPQIDTHRSFIDKFLEICNFAFNFPGCFVCNRRMEVGSICSTCTPFDFEVLIPAQNRCTACFRPLPHESRLCPHCVTSPGELRHIRALYIYTERVKQLIRAMKFDGIDRVATILGDAMGTMLTRAFPCPDWDVVVPIPISEHRLSVRGFNQCQTLAQVIAGYIECPMIPALRFGKGSSLTIPQSLQSYRSRLSLARQNPFVVRGRSATKSVKNKRVLLVDDVLTSGATATAAVKALKNAGAQTVDLYTLAISTHWKGPLHPRSDLA